MILKYIAHLFRIISHVCFFHCSFFFLQKKSKTECLCGDEEAFKKLGKADHITASAPCHHAIWSMRTYVARSKIGNYATCHHLINA